MTHEKKIICPSCLGSVRDFIVDHRLTVNHCFSCKMLWLDSGEEELMLGTRISEQLTFYTSRTPFFGDAPMEPDARQLTCPHCENSCLNQRSIHKLRYWKCDACSGHLFEMETIRKLKKLAQAENSHIARSTQERNRNAQHINPYNPRSRFLFHSNTSRVAIPVVALLAFLFVKLGGGIVLYLTGMIIHEIGHSAAGWLSGIPNIITPVMVLLVGDDTRYGVAISLIIIFSLMLYLWIKKSQKIPQRTEFFLISLFLMTLCLAQFFCSFTLSLERKLIFVTFSGVVGEFAISAFLVVIFCFRSIPIPRWDFWRYPLMIYGVVHFVCVWSRWSEIFADHSLIPWGSAVSSDVADGDLAKLRDAYGFTQEQILTTIAQTRRICLALILTGLVSLFVRKDDQFLSNNDS